jgi:hypothetical protein
MGDGRADHFDIGLTAQAELPVTERVRELFSKVESCRYHWRFVRTPTSRGCVEGFCLLAEGPKMDAQFDNPTLTSDPLIRDLAPVKGGSGATPSQLRANTVGLCDVDLFDPARSHWAWMPADELRACKAGDKCIPVELICRENTGRRLRAAVPESRLPALQANEEIARFENRCELGCKWSPAPGSAYCAGSFCEASRRPDGRSNPARPKFPDPFQQ